MLMYRNRAQKSLPADGVNIVGRLLLSVFILLQGLRVIVSAQDSLTAACNTCCVVLDVVFDEVLAGHVGRLLESHYVED